MKWSYKKKVNVGVAIFLVWVLVQFFRATFGREPYPAIYLPGFRGNGKKNLVSRELYVKKKDTRRYIEYKQTPLGHVQYRKLLEDFSDVYLSGDSVRLVNLEQRIKSIGIIKAGDSLQIREFVWVPINRGYKKINSNLIKHKLK